MKYSSKTDNGKKRENNQDSHFIGQNTDGTLFAVVCDGMGGAGNGDIASKMAVDYIVNTMMTLYRPNMSDLVIKSILVSAVEEANKLIFERAGRDKALSGMGTTVVAALISEEFAYIAHAGDSRAYLINEGGIIQLTRDHSVVQNMLERGEITSLEAENHPKKNLITRALGVEKTVKIDFYQEEFPKGARLLMCTDGLSNYVSAGEIIEICSCCETEGCSQRLVDRANKNGGGDNITVIVAENE